MPSSKPKKKSTNHKPRAPKTKRVISHAARGVVHLSRREQQCLEGVLRRETAKEIAASLGLSHRTVEQYIGQIMRKAGVHSQGDLRNLLV